MNEPPVYNGTFNLAIFHCNLLDATPCKPNLYTIEHIIQLSYNLHLLLYSIYCYFCNPIKGNFSLQPLYSNSIGWPIKWISTKTEIISWIAWIKCRISSFFIDFTYFFCTSTLFTNSITFYTHPITIHRSIQWTENMNWTSHVTWHPPMKLCGVWMFIWIFNSILIFWLPNFFYF